MSLVRSAALISVLATPALACPGAGDLENGIRVIYDDAFEEVYSPLPGGDVQIREIYPEGGEGFVRLANGYLKVEGFIWDNGRPVDRWIYSYPAGNPLPDAGPNIVWEGDVKFKDVQGDVYVSVETYTFGDRRKALVGGCNYEMIPLELVYDGYVDLVHYLPELGFGYTAESGTVDNPRESVYRVTEIYAE
jgi:hypothetical protein